MSLSTWEQQALDSIKDGLAGSDPKLVALLTTFTQLASEEEMPVSERIRAAPRRAIQYSRCKRRHPRRDKVRRHTPRVYQRLGFQRAALLLWLLITVVLIPVALALNAGSRQGACTESWATVCASSAPAKSSGPVSHKTVTTQAPHQRAVRTHQTNRQ